MKTKTMKTRQRLKFDTIPEPSQPERNFESSPIQTAPTLTTADILRPVPANIDIPNRPPPSSVLPSHQLTLSVFSNADASLSNGPPISPPSFRVSKEFSPCRGVYLLTASTGAGKTILTMALTAWCNAIGLPSTYISCFEPRSGDWQGFGSDSTPFSEPQNFWHDVDMTISTSARLKLIVYDSVTLPMKAKASEMAWQHQPTFTRGMQPSDRAFLEDGSKRATRHNAIFVLPLNTSLIPYVDDLAGGVEGIINVLNIESFMYADRSPSTGRVMHQVSIPSQYVQIALAKLKLGVLRSSSSTTKTGFEGIK